MDVKERTNKIYWHLTGMFNFAPVAKEPFFSKSPCECCKSKLGGERYEFTATVGKKHTDKRELIVCCVDCYMVIFG